MEPGLFDVMSGSTYSSYESDAGTNPSSSIIFRRFEYIPPNSVYGLDVYANA